MTAELEPRGGNAPLDPLFVEQLRRIAIEGQAQPAVPCRIIWLRDGRHRTALIEAVDEEGGRVLFVKMRGTSQFLGDLTLAVERHVRAVIEAAASIKVYSSVPLIVGGDNDFLVFEGIPGAASLAEHDLSVESGTSARWAAETMATLHQIPLHFAENLRPIRMPVPTYGNITPDKMASGLGLNEHFLRLVQISPSLNDALRTTSAEWCADTIVHGDFQVSNVLQLESDATRLFIVDWELSGIGDRHWDMATLVASAYYRQIIMQRPPPTKWINCAIAHYQHIAAYKLNVRKLFAYTAAWLALKTQVNIAFGVTPTKIDVESLFLAASIVD
ncbi:phosphotransferase family protein [Roseibium sp. RP-7]